MLGCASLLFVMFVFAVMVLCLYPVVMVGITLSISCSDGSVSKLLEVSNIK